MSLLEDIDDDIDFANAEKKKVRRKKHQREADRKKISDMYLEGQSQYAIGQSLSLSQSQVSTELAIVRKNWVEETTIEIDIIKAEKLKELEWAKREFRLAWEKSKRLKKISTKRGRFNAAQASGVTGSPTPTTFEILEEEELGDKKYMDGYLQCISEELKITGGYAPKKIAETDPTGTKEAGQAVREEILSMLDNIQAKVNAAKPKELNPANLAELAEQEKNYIDAEEIPETPEVLPEEITETYKLLGQTKGFLCLKCEKVTWKEIDFQNKYCPSCNVYHENVDQQVMEEPEGVLDPSKLHIYDPAESSEANSVVVAVGNSQEQVAYNKQHDSNMSKKLGEMSRITNFGIKGR